ncbi:hypothetical protein [Curtobacterium sp. MCPF17_003]|uniref:hypothetical protein n=1 Tax=Curtobacterium sp. MCPF17_003 TaxID=2175637 RepID=UPI0015E8813D|nr:hypothetical protein [Curtobacterium sp. MCPF17_003]
MLVAALHARVIEHAHEATADARKRAAAAAAAAAASKLSADVDAHDIEAYRGLQDAVAALIAGFDDPLFTATEAAVRSRCSPCCCSGREHRLGRGDCNGGRTREDLTVDVRRRGRPASRPFSAAVSA